MNSKVKEQWLKALRSGEYKQGAGCLKNNDEFCCLGVLSDIYAKEKNLKWNDEFYDRGIDDGFIYGRSAIPSNFVCKWAELKEPNPVVYLDGCIDSVARMNDEGYTFEQIADVIEKEL